MIFRYFADLTFTHEGNKTYLIEGLVNFEKMVKINYSFLPSNSVSTI